MRFVIWKDISHGCPYGQPYHMVISNSRTSLLDHMGVYNICVPGTK